MSLSAYTYVSIGPAISMAVLLSIVAFVIPMK
jgi:hypothetical protein